MYQVVQERAQQSPGRQDVGRVWTRYVKQLHVNSAVSNSLRPRGLQPARLLCPRDFLGKNTGVGCHFLLQGIFGTQG